MMQCQGRRSADSLQSIALFSVRLYLFLHSESNHIRQHQAALAVCLSTQQRPSFTDHPALNLVRTFRDDRGSSKTKPNDRYQNFDALTIMASALIKSLPYTATMDLSSLSRASHQVHLSIPSRFVAKEPG